uniref:Uncharacterized protein n=1 Tax=viral metagenome TaxID=1070528 RepID=A0A6C0D5F4_9ZZZZ
MASYARSYLSSLREDPMKKKLMNTLGAIVVSIIFIVSGSFLIMDQKTIGDLDNSKKDDFHYYSGVVNIVLGILIALYILYSLFFR